MLNGVDSKNCDRTDEVVLAALKAARSKQEDIDKTFNEFSDKLNIVKMRNTVLIIASILFTGCCLLSIAFMLIRLIYGVEPQFDLFGILTILVTIGAAFFCIWLVLSVIKQEGIENALLEIGKWRSDSGYPFLIEDEKEIEELKI